MSCSGDMYSGVPTIRPPAVARDSSANVCAGTPVVRVLNNLIDEFDDLSGLDVDQVLGKYKAYMADQRRRGVYLKHMTRHLLGLFAGYPGAKAWRRTLTELSADPRADVDTVERARAWVRWPCGF